VCINLFSHEEEHCLLLAWDIFFLGAAENPAAVALSRHRTYTPASKPPMFTFNFFASFQRPAVKVSA
jgi:hypothetical protein